MRTLDADLESSASNTTVVMQASDLPSRIAVGQTVELGADIELASGQTIEAVEGVLDGKGHTITLADEQLARTVSGTIQNLVVTSAKTISKGVFAATLSGTIRACASTASQYVAGLDDLGGFVDTLAGGTISHSYSAGSNTSMFAAGFASAGSGGTLDQCLYTQGFTALGTFASVVSNTSMKTTVEQLASADSVAYLNTGLYGTGYRWALPDAESPSNLPVLIIQDTEASADKDALFQAIEVASSFAQDGYTPESWAAFASALAKAREIYSDPQAKQIDVDQAAHALIEAQDQLVEVRPNEPVELPAEGVAHVSSAAELKAIDVTDPDIYIVLDEDIVIDDSYWCYKQLAGVLDGAGHTVSFASGTSLFDGVAPEGVVQNTHFTGTFDTYDTSSYMGPLGNRIEGAVLNCSTDIAGSYACGFATRLSGGTIANCYSISTGTSGALVREFESGIVSFVYWLEGANVPKDLAAQADSSQAMAADDMKTKQFVGLLNEHKGAYGTAWGQKATGYPYFGVDQEFNPDPKPTYGSDYPMTFETYDGTVFDVPEDGMFTVSPDEVDPTFHMAGAFALSGVPETSEISWSLDEVTPEATMLVNLENGQLRVDGAGTAVLVATERADDGSSKTVARIFVTAQSRTIAEMKLFIGDEEVTNGAYTVSGSEQKSVSARVRYEGADSFVAVAPSRFSYKVDNPDIVHSSEDSSAFYFTEPGTTKMTISLRSQQDVQASIALTSLYVPVTSVVPAVSGSVELHGRNANSDGGMDFLPDYSGVIVEPVNASFAGEWTVSSSDPSIAEYVSSMVKGYVAYKAGEVCFTASIVDRDPATGQSRTVEGSSTVTYEYLNPLVSLTCADSSYELSLGEKRAVDLSFSGPRSAEGYHVSEPGIMWTFDTPGVVSIERSAAGQWVHNPDSPENFMYLPNSDYTITALSEGTVRVTGVPLDESGGAQPIAFTVTVAGSGSQVDDAKTLASAGIESALAYIDAEQGGAFAYNDEWEIIGLSNAGRVIDASAADAYVASAANAARDWSVRTKPTEIARVCLAISSLGRNAADVGGVDLTLLLWNSALLTEGSNEAAWAIIALDACGGVAPEGAAWTTDAMIETLLSFQCADGGFGLYSNTDSGVDTTAMALQALSAHRDAPGVKQAIASALEYLRGQVKTTGFGTPEADAQVLMALCELGIDPVNEANGFGSPHANLITSIMAYRASDADGFAHTIGGKPQDMSTVQALLGLVAYRDGVFDNVPSTDPAVEDVRVLIDAIGEVTLDSRGDIAAARAAYAALDDSQRAQIDARELFAAETAYGTLLAATFTDVSGHWVSVEQWLVPALGRGIMAGYTDQNAAPTGLFGPDDALTRAQAAVIVYRYANPASRDTFDPEKYAQTSVFFDVAGGEYYTAAVNWCAEQGIVSGRDGAGADHPFCPDDLITREELAKILANTARYFGADTEVDDPSALLGTFPDAASASAWAAPYLAWCVSEGVITGSLPDGALAPGDIATRAQAAKVFVGLLCIVEGTDAA